MSHPLRRESKTSERLQGSAASHLSARPGDCHTEAVLASLLDSLECGVLICGAEGDLWAVNDRFAEIVGTEPESCADYVIWGNSSE